MWLQLLLVGFVGLISYHNAFSAGFVFDDVVTVVGNPYLGNLEYLGYLLQAQPGRAIGYLTYFINFGQAGLNPFWYHAVNVIIHILNALVVYYFVYLLQRVTDSTRKAFSSNQFLPLVVALLFVSHPIQTQAVTYISQRFTILAAFFYVSSLVFYLRSKLYPSRHLINIVISYLLAICAFFTKEISFTLPFAISAIELCFFVRRPQVKKSFIKVLPFFVISGFIFLLLYVFPATKGGIGKHIPLPTMVQGSSISRIEYARTQFPVVATYVRLLFLPINQVVDYDFPIVKSVLENRFVISAFVIIALIIISLKAYNKNRFVSFGIFFFFIALLVESSIIPIVDVIFEHRVYLPSVGFFIAVGSLYVHTLNRFRNKNFLRSGLMILFVFVLGICSYTTFQRNFVWQNEYTLWSDAVVKSPRKARVHYNLGVAAAEVGKWDQAEKELLRTIDLEPRYVKAYQNLSFIYEREGDKNKAIEFKKIVEGLTKK